MFLSSFKNYICKFIQANSWYHKLFRFHLPFWVWKVWQGRGKKKKKNEYLENEKRFLDEIKNIFHRFWKAIIWWKNKNLLKIADTSFKFGERSLRALGPKIWNKLPLYIEYAKNLSIFENLKNSWNLVFCQCILCQTFEKREELASWALVFWIQTNIILQFTNWKIMCKLTLTSFLANLYHWL